MGFQKRGPIPTNSSVFSERRRGRVESPDVLRARPYALEIGLEGVDDCLIRNQDKIVVLVGEPGVGKVAGSRTQYLPIDSVSLQMHQNARAFDPREDVGVGQQRFDEAAPNGSVLGELRLVEIEADDDVAFRGVGQSLDDFLVRQDISRHVDGQFGAPNLLNVDGLQILLRRIMDLDLGSRLGPGCDRQDQTRYA